MKRFCSSCGLYSTALCSQTGGYGAQIIYLEKKKKKKIKPAQAATCLPSPDCPLEEKKKKGGVDGSVIGDGQPAENG